MEDSERIEKTLIELDQKKDGRMVVQAFLQETLKDLNTDYHSYKRVQGIIVDEGFAKNINPAFGIFEITAKGREIVRSGGYLKYVERKEEKEKEGRKLKELQLQQTETGVKLNKFYYKYRWIPFALSLLALLISILVAIFK